MRKNIKNYTSSAPVENTVANIQKILARAGAKKIMFDYDSTGNLSSITFGLEIEGKQYPYVLPVNPFKLAMILFGREFNMLKENQQMQVRRTAWKNIQDWIDAQMALSMRTILALMMRLVSHTTI